VKYVTKKEIVSYEQKYGVLKLTREEYETLKNIVLRYLKEVKYCNDLMLDRWHATYGDLKIERICLLINYPEHECLFRVEVEE